MAFIPQKNYLEETIINNYNLTGGTESFNSSDISNYTILSLQFIYSSTKIGNIFIVEQSNDLTNWILLTEELEIPVGSGNFVIDKGSFTGKYIRIRFITKSEGTLSVKMIAKR